MVMRVGLSGPGGGKEEVVLCDNVGLAQGEVPVEDVKEFPLDAADIALSEQPSPRRPIGVLWRCIIYILNE
jgi:hypothetical protein